MQLEKKIWNETDRATKLSEMGTTSDAGSQYRCGRVGMGIQPPSTLQPIDNTQTETKSIGSARFPTFQLDHRDSRTNGRTDGRTDKAAHRVAWIRN